VAQLVEQRTANPRIGNFMPKADERKASIEQYGCPYMDSSSFASKLFWQVWHDCKRISGLFWWHTLMPGHNGLFARQLPIALSYFSYVDISGFG
jgi:hypothetical protein